MEGFLKKEKGTVYIFPDGTMVDVEDTEEMARRAAALKEEQGGLRELLLDLGATCLQGGYREAGVIYVGKAMALADDRMRVDVCLRMGLWQESLNDFESAARIYALAVNSGPVRADYRYFVHNNLGYCLNKCGRFAEAEPYCRAAININPGAHNAYKNLGLSLAGQGQYAEAARQFVKAFEICPGDARSIAHLEDMLQAHPETVAEVPGITAWVATLRAQALPRTGLH